MRTKLNFTILVSTFKIQKQLDLINLSNELMIAILDAARFEKNIILEKNVVKMDYYKDRIYRALVH